MQTIKVPDLGGASEVEVIELCVSSGDSVDEGQSLIVVESDKASMDIPSPVAGTIASIEVTEGSSVTEGDIILSLDAGDVDLDVDDEKNAEVSPPAVADNDESQSENSSTVSLPDSTNESEQSIHGVAIPDLGGADPVEIIEISVAVGDQVDEGDGLLVMESDKATMDLPSPVSGKVTAIHTKLESNVSEGDIVFDIEVSSTAEGTVKASPVNGPKSENEKPVAEQSAIAPTSIQKVDQGSSNQETKKIDSGISSSNEGVYAGPAVRKLARELGVDLSIVKGTGPKGRIAKQDLHDFVKQVVQSNAEGGNAGTGAGIPQIPAVDFSVFGEIDVQPMSKIHKLTAANMHRSWLNVPHVTQYDDADITDLEIFRKSLKPQMEQRGIKISPLPFVFKAVVAAMKANPAFNTSLGSDGESIVHKKYFHIGMAVDTPAGLVVPVLRNVDKKGIWELAEEILELATKAKERKLKPAEMQGGCFTISSLGGIGGNGFTPIINAPEVGILGISKLATKPVYINESFEPRKMLPLSLSYDHRAINGGDAGRFLTFLAAQLADVRHLLM